MIFNLTDIESPDPSHRDYLYGDYIIELDRPTGYWDWMFTCLIDFRVKEGAQCFQSKDVALAEAIKAVNTDSMRWDLRGFINYVTSNQLSKKRVDLICGNTF